MIDLDTHKLIRASRLVLALAAGTISAYFLKIPMSAWIMVSISVVLFDQDTLGGTINRSSLRIMATIYSALISLFCIIFFPHNWYIIWPVITLSVFIYAYIYMGSKKSYIGSLGTMTLGMLMLSDQGPNLLTAIYRLLDIVLGVSVALLMMLVFFPAYAVNKAYNLIFSSIQDITNLIEIINQETDIEAIRHLVVEVETSFITDVINFNKVIEEARYEVKARKNPQLIATYSKCVLQIRRLYRLIIVIFYYELESNHLESYTLNNIWEKLLRILNLILAKNFSHSISLDYLELDELITQIKPPTLQKNLHHLAAELCELHKILKEQSSPKV